MAKTADEQKEPQSFSKKDTEKEKCIFIRTKVGYFKEERHYLYAIPAIGTPPASEKAEHVLGVTRKLRPFSSIPSIVSSQSACVAWDSSIIYVFNGGYDQLGPEVLYFNTKNPNEGWKRAPPMSTVRRQPYAMVVGGKIYVMGPLDERRARKDNDQDQQQQQPPWGEVLDPLMNEWRVLVPHPSLVSFNVVSHAVLDDGKKVLLHPECNHVHGVNKSLYLYDTDTKSWEIINQDFNSGRKLLPCAVSDDIMYYYYNYEGEVRAYDAVTHKWIAEPVRGLDKNKGVLLPTDRRGSSDSDPENVFMVHLGNGNLCLLWENSRRLDGYGWRKFVRCTKFRVIKHGGDGGQDIILHALIESFSEYSLGDGDATEEILSCLVLRQNRRGFQCSA